MTYEKRNRIKWIAVIAASVMIVAGLITAIILVNQNKSVAAKTTASISEITEAPVEKLQYNENISMVSLRLGPSSSMTTLEGGNQTVSKTITATVMPVDAPDKSVDWSIEWCTPIEGKDIGEYLTIIPDSDGSLTARITAYKGFEGASAYVTATTRVGGFTATCLITYEGAPETLAFKHNGREIESMGTAVLTAGTTNELSLNLKNTLGAVGSKYGDFEIVSIKAQGRFTMKKEYVVNGTVSSTQDIVFNLAEGTYKYQDEVSGNELTLEITPDKFLTCSIADGNLIVNAIRSESSYINGNPRTGYRFSYKGTYTDPRSGGVADNCQWYVLVRDKVSGIESLIYIDIQSTVTGISLSDSVYSF